MNSLYGYEKFVSGKVIECTDDNNLIVQLENGEMGLVLASEVGRREYTEKASFGWMVGKEHWNFLAGEMEGAYRMLSGKAYEEAQYKQIVFDYENKNRNVYFGTYHGVSPDGKIAFYWLAQGVDCAIWVSDLSLTKIRTFKTMALPKRLAIAIKNVDNQGRIQGYAKIAFGTFKDNVDRMELEPQKIVTGVVSGYVPNSSDSIVSLSPNLTVTIAGRYDFGVGVKVKVVRVDSERQKVKVDFIEKFNNPKFYFGNWCVDWSTIPLFVEISEFEKKIGPITGKRREGSVHKNEARQDFSLETNSKKIIEQVEIKVPNNNDDINCALSCNNVDSGDNAEQAEMSLLRVFPNEKCEPSVQAGFSTSKLYWNIENKNFHALHFEALDWVGFFKYCTNQLLFRLFYAHYIPLYSHEVVGKAREDLDSIIEKSVKKQISLKEGENEIDTTFPVKTSNNRLGRLFKNQLNTLGLVEEGKFVAQNMSPGIARIYLLSNAGCELLRAQGRANYRYDAYAYMRDTRHIKQILSGNQLMVAYIEMLHRIFLIKRSEIKIDNYIIVNKIGDEGDDFGARVAFQMSVYSRENELNKVIVLGESIRNTVGISKAFDELSLSEKIPRLLSVANQYAMNQATDVILNYVFISYDEMCARGKIIEQELNKITDRSNQFHVLYTYDRRVMGEGNNAVFSYNDETGDFEQFDVISMVRKLV